MFTGIIQTVGRVATLQPKGGDLRLRVAAAGLDLDQVALGDSIATNGVCLTVTAKEGDSYWADVSAESVARSTLGQLRVGDPLNLELALTNMYTSIPSALYFSYLATGDERYKALSLRHAHRVIDAAYGRYFGQAPAGLRPVAVLFLQLFRHRPAPAELLTST